MALGMTAACPWICCAAQTERAFQRQLGVNGGFKSKEKKAPGKSGHRYWKNIGLGFKTPKEAIEGVYTQLRLRAGSMHAKQWRQGPMQLATLGGRR